MIRFPPLLPLVLNHQYDRTTTDDRDGAHDDQSGGSLDDLQDRPKNEPSKVTHVDSLGVALLVGRPLSWTRPMRLAPGLPAQAATDQVQTEATHQHGVAADAEDVHGHLGNGLMFTA